VGPRCSRAEEAAAVRWAEERGCGSPMGLLGGDGAAKRRALRREVGKGLGPERGRGGGGGGGGVGTWGWGNPARATAERGLRWAAPVGTGGNSTSASTCTVVVGTRDQNGFVIFRYSENQFRIFSIGFTGNGIFQKRNRFSEFSIRIGVVFYRPFPSVTGFSRKLPDLCLKIFQNCVSEFFSM
jgi:hypothetical protein